MDGAISPAIKHDVTKELGFFIYPSQLFANVVKMVDRNENLNTDLAQIFNAIEASSSGYPSESDIKGLFADFDTTSTRLGATVKDKNIRLAAVLKGVAGLDFGGFDTAQIDLFGDAKELKANLVKQDNKIIVTTIQKLNNLMKGEGELAIYKQQVVFIFDECHRSQFGEAQKNLKRKFKFFYQFGFTGTPIFVQNAYGSETTSDVFGRELHSYVITDAIRDEKVLKFKVDYNNLRPKFKNLETKRDAEKLKIAEKAFLHPERIKEISRYILENFHHKMHRLNSGNSGFNAMFAVSTIEAAKLYYEALQSLQAEQSKKLKIATIFSFAVNEESNNIGEIGEESFDITALNSSAKEFLTAAMQDYNSYFKTSYSVEGDGFQNYYRDLAKRVKQREIDLS